MLGLLNNNKYFILYVKRCVQLSIRYSVDPKISNKTFPRHTNRLASQNIFIYFGLCVHYKNELSLTFS